MDIPITEIIELLDPYNPEYFLSSNEYQTINDVVLAETCTTTINPTLLYISDVENLHRILKLDCYGTVLCTLSDAGSKQAFSSNKLNLILLNTSKDLNEMYQIIQEIVTKKREFLRKKNLLVDSLLSCKGLQSIIDTGYKVFGNPMFVSDLAYNILAFNNNASVDDPSWPNVGAEEYETYERLRKLNDTSVFEELYKSNVPVISTFDYTPFRWVANKISINGKNIGHIAVVESEKSFEDTDIEILQFLCCLVARELQKNMNENLIYENAYEYFFVDLLDEKIVKNEIIQEHVHTLNLKFKKNIFVMTISKADNGAGSISLAFIKNYISHFFNNQKSVLYKNQIVLFLSTDKNEPFSDVNRNKFLEFLTSNQMFSGISQCFHHISHLKQHYLQSIKAIELGCHLHQAKLLFDYNDYSIDHLIDIAGTNYDLRSFCNPLLFDLIDYDKKYKTNYSHYLYIYLLNESSITKTSEVFQIHRNSMKYRIDKIEEILNISLHSIEIKLSFYMTFKILHYMGKDRLYILTER